MFGVEVWSRLFWATAIGGEVVCRVVCWRRFAAGSSE